MFLDFSGISPLYFDQLEKLKFHKYHFNKLKRTELKIQSFFSLKYNFKHFYNYLRNSNFATYTIICNLALYFDSFMKLLIFIIVVYIVFRLSARYLFPYLLKRYVKKMQSRFHEQNGGTPPPQNENSTKNKSKVTINYPGRKKHFDIENIDYTDYEEVNENEMSNKQ